MTYQKFTENGKDFIIIDLQTYENMIEALEDYEDLKAIRDFQKNPEEAFPLSLYNTIDSGTHPITALREYRQLKPSELAKKSGISQAFLNQIENNIRKGSMKTLKSIAKALGVTVDMITF